MGFRGLRGGTDLPVRSVWRVRYSVLEAEVEERVGKEKDWGGS